MNTEIQQVMSQEAVVNYYKNRVDSLSSELERAQSSLTEAERTLSNLKTEHRKAAKVSAFRQIYGGGE